MAIGACLIVSLMTLMMTADRGINLADESFYLLWIRQPDQFPLSVTPFGVFFKPFLDVLDNSIVAIRVFGIVFLAGSGVLLGGICHLYCKVKLNDSSGRTVLPLLGGLFQLTYYVLWILTPSYNSLANASAAIVLSGCLGWLTVGPRGRGNLRLDWLSSFLVGLGGCYAFFGKPTFATLASVGVLAVLLTTMRGCGLKHTLMRVLVAGLSCVVPLYLHIVYVMPIPDFAQTLGEGSRALAGSYSPLALFLRTLNEVWNAPGLFTTSFVVFILSMSWALARGNTRPPKALIAAAAIVFIANIWTLAIAAWSTLNLWRIYWTALGPEMYAVLITIVSVGLLMRPRVRKLEYSAAGLITVLMLLPFALAFGSANPFVRQISISLFGPFLGTAIAARLLFDKTLASVLQVGLALTSVVLVVFSTFMPYRLTAPIINQTNPINVPFYTSRIYVDDSTKEYVDTLRMVAKREGLAPGTPVLDLSGGGPGTALFLAARPAGNPWLVPLSAAGASVADALWSTLSSSERERAWVLGPIHPGFRNTDIARKISANDKSYECVGASTMDFWEPYGVPEPITLWKPATNQVRDRTPLNCQGATLVLPPAALAP